MAAGSIEAGKAFIRLLLDDKRLNSGLDALAGKFRRFGAVGGAVSAPLIAGFAGAIKVASDLEETMNKFNVVFGDQSETVKAWGDDFANTIGRSEKQIADFLAGSQDLFVPLGFEPGAATELSKQITGLAVDLASFNNMADGDALRDLHAALTGSGEVMKKYGVIVSEAAVKQELLNQGLDPKAATDQQKVMARLNIILAGTTAAQGDAQRSAGSFANQMKALQGAAMDAAAAVGEAILPTVTQFITKAVEITASLRDWIKEHPGVVRAIAAISTGIAAASAAAVTFGVVLAIISAHPIIAALTAISALVLGLATYFGLASDGAKDFGKQLDVVKAPVGTKSNINAARKQQAAQVQRDLQTALTADRSVPAERASRESAGVISEGMDEVVRWTRATAEGVERLITVAQQSGFFAGVG